jgi:hypothetical protein
MSFKQFLKEAESKTKIAKSGSDWDDNAETYEVKSHGSDFELQAIDTTHARMRVKGSTSRPAIYHNGQLSDEVKKQLKDKGAFQKDRDSFVED